MLKFVINISNIAADFKSSFKYSISFYVYTIQERRCVVLVVLKIKQTQKWDILMKVEFAFNVR